MNSSFPERLSFSYLNLTKVVVTHVIYELRINEPQHNKTNKMVCAPSEDSDQPGNPPSLIRVLAKDSVGS